MTRRWPETLLWIAFAAVGVGLLELLPTPRESIFWTRAFDSGHVPLFAGFAFVLYRMARLWLPRWNPYLTSLVAVGLLAGVTEGIQIVSPRDADAMDGVRDLAGGAAMVGLLWSLRPGPAWRAWAVRAAVAATVVVSFVPFARCVYAHRVRAAAFPRVIAFTSATERVFFDLEGADVEFGGGTARVRFRSGARTDYPRFGFEPMADWRGYRQLLIDAVNPSGEPVTLHLRIHDYQHDRYTFSDRFNTEFVLATGPNQLAVDLAEVERAPATRRLDLAEVKNVAFFVPSPPRDVVIELVSVRLR